MTESLLLLFACQLVGEVIHHLGLLPLPGPVTGLALLFGMLCWRGRHRVPGRPDIPREVGEVSDSLLRHLSILYVPASVGIAERLDVLGAHPLAILLALVMSTVLAQAATALVFEGLLRRRPHTLTSSGQIR